MLLESSIACRPKPEQRVRSLWDANGYGRECNLYDYSNELCGHWKYDDQYYDQ
jgi:hypothetical protein